MWPKNSTSNSGQSVDTGMLQNATTTQGTRVVIIVFGTAVWSIEYKNNVLLFSVYTVQAGCLVGIYY